MATRTLDEQAPTTGDLRSELAAERAHLATSLDHLRRSLDVGTSMESRLPLVLAGAFLAGFVLSGGLGAAMRLLARRGREGHTKLRLGRLLVVER